MYEDEYKQTYKTLNERYCPFEKSILTRQCCCEHAHRFHIADREGVGCRSVSAQPTCVDLLDLLRSNAQFALGMSTIPRALTHQKEMKVQMGGLFALQHLLSPGNKTSHVENIYGVIRAAQDAYGDITSLPYSEMVKSIASYQVKRRRRR